MSKAKLAKWALVAASVTLVTGGLVALGAPAVCLATAPVLWGLCMAQANGLVW